MNKGCEPVVGFLKEANGYQRSVYVNKYIKHYSVKGRIVAVV